METQFDPIAKQYQNVKKWFYYKMVDYSYLKVAGNINGLDAIDLACGDGHVARQLKKNGANKVVGVDVSKEMISLAREQERHTPCGIEYICSAVENLDYIGKFDLATGMYLLHNARNKDELAQMCEKIYMNLKDGGQFIGINNNGLKKSLFCDYSRYSARIIAKKDIKEGEQYRDIVTFEGKPIEILVRYYSRETYNEILQEAGFKNIQWVNLLLPPEAEKDPVLRPFRPAEDHLETLIVCNR